MRLLSILVITISLIAVMIPQHALAYSANKVWLETMDDGRIRVAVQYTVPALKEFRLAHAIFTNRAEADTFYWHLIKGGEFSVNGPAQLRFIPPKSEPSPW
jgi:hypothetical protein